jgi:hypothetical protein
MAVKSSAFLDIMAYSQLKVNQCFGGTCCLHIQSQRISQARNQQEAGRQLRALLHIGFLLGLFSNGDNGGDIFFRNIG